MQKDLFGSATITALPNQFEQKADFLDRYKITLKLDQGLVVAISLLILYVLVFSYGVESGKRYAMAEIKAERAKRERMAQELGEKIFANQTSLAKTLPAVTVPVPASIVAVAPASAPVAALQAVPAPSPVVAAAPVAASTGKFGIQTITFSSQSKAEGEVRRLRGYGYPAFVITSGKGKLHQVCVGGYATRQEASKAMEQLKDKNWAPKDAYLRNIA